MKKLGDRHRKLVYVLIAILLFRWQCQSDGYVPDVL